MIFQQIHLIAVIVVATGIAIPLIVPIIVVAGVVVPGTLPVAIITATLPAAALVAVVTTPTPVVGVIPATVVGVIPAAMMMAWPRIGRAILWNIEHLPGINIVRIPQSVGPGYTVRAHVKLPANAVQRIPITDHIVAAAATTITAPSLAL